MKDEKTVDVRGAIRFELGGKEYSLDPSFANLARVEQTTNKTVVGIFAQSQTGNISVVDIAKVITHCAKPTNGKLPEGWNHLDVGQNMMDEGFPQYVGLVVTFLGAAMSAKPAKRVDSGGEVTSAGE